MRTLSIICSLIWLFTPPSVLAAEAPAARVVVATVTDQQISETTRLLGIIDFAGKYFLPEDFYNKLYRRAVEITSLQVPFPCKLEESQLPFEKQVVGLEIIRFVTLYLAFIVVT